MADNPLQSRVDAVRQLLALFRLERMVYLGVTCCSLGVLLACALLLLLRPQADVVAIVGLVSGSGGIVYTSGRLLRMWADALRMLGAPETSEKPS